jgi:hypothetical protein
MFLNDIEIPGWFRRLPATRELILRHDAEQAKTDAAERQRLQAERAALLLEQEAEMEKLIAAKRAAIEKEKKAQAAFDAAIDASRRAAMACYSYSHSTSRRIAALEARLQELALPAITIAAAKLVALTDAIRNEGYLAYHTELESNWLSGATRIVATNLHAVPRRLEAIHEAGVALGQLQYRDVPDVNAEVARILTAIPNGIHSPVTPAEKVA